MTTHHPPISPDAAPSNWLPTTLPPPARAHVPKRRREEARWWELFRPSVRLSGSDLNSVQATPLTSETVYQARARIIEVKLRLKEIFRDMECKFRELGKIFGSEGIFAIWLRSRSRNVRPSVRMGNGSWRNFRGRKAQLLVYLARNIFTFFFKIPLRFYDEFNGRLNCCIYVSPRPFFHPFLKLH